MLWSALLLSPRVNSSGGACVSSPPVGDSKETQGGREEGEERVRRVRGGSLRKKIA